MDRISVLIVSYILTVVVAGDNKRGPLWRWSIEVQ